MGLLLGHLLALELGLGLPQTKPVGLDVPLGLGVGIVSVLQVAFEIQDIFLSFFFILRDLALPLASVSTAACMFSRPLPMFFLVEANSFSSRQSCARSPALPHLGKLELSTEDLFLVLIESSLILVEGSLQLHLLSLKALADFVNLVDGAYALADLVH